MVVRVAPGQVRFVLPALSVDARGVAQGRDLALRFSTMERLVTFLRFVSADVGLDELGASLRLRFARAAHGTRELLLLIEQVSPHVVDVVVQSARAAQGQGYTGTGRHFVSMRDAQSPLGYDVETVSSQPGDLVLYGGDQPTAYTFDGELTLQQLLLRLELQRLQAGPESLSPRKMPPLLYVTVRQGLGPALVQALAHAGVRAWAALIEPPASTSGALTEPRLWLLRIEQAPARLWGLFAHTPGVTTFVPVSDNVLVATGFRHPVHLDSCRGVFADDRLVLFAPPPQAPRVIMPAPKLLPIDDLVRLPMALTQATRPLPTPASSTHIELHTELRLVRVPPRAEGPAASLVPWSQTAWIKRIAAGLPQPALANYRIAALPQGLLVVGSLQWFPFGTLLTAAARGVLVPVGFALRPAVSQSLLEERLGTSDGSLVVFRSPDEAPFRVAGGDLVPLQSHVLGVTTVVRQEPLLDLQADDERAAPEIRYENSFAMPLWGRR
ncbi:MAG: hypothetical protein SF187_11275 [Deltaproteobacteria bacterium]|nr:hypothetical protein [Deltaproteobacteria bacterium]